MPADTQPEIVRGGGRNHRRGRSYGGGGRGAPRGRAVNVTSEQTIPPSSNMGRGQESELTSRTTETSRKFPTEKLAKPDASGFQATLSTPMALTTTSSAYSTSSRPALGPSTNPTSLDALKGFNEKFSQLKADDPESRPEDDIVNDAEASFGHMLNAHEGHFHRSNQGTIRSVVSLHSVNDSSVFTWGKVFIMKWYETQGVKLDQKWLANKSRPTQMPERGSDNRDRFIGKSRYMMVIADLKSHSVCVPIRTYGGIACEKGGMKDSEIRCHAVIYDENLTPFYKEDEPKDIMLKPIPMYVYDGARLDELSRIRFDWPCSVAHNVRIRQVGYVRWKDKPMVMGYLKKSLSKLFDADDSPRKSEYTSAGTA